LLVECEDPLLLSRVKVLQAQLQEMQTKYEAEYFIDQLEAQLIQENINHTRARLERAQEQLDKLVIKSPADGVFLMPRAEDMPGRYVEQGELLGYVLDVEKPTVRVVVEQSAADLVRQRVREVQVRLAERIEDTIPAVILKEVPGALENLPSTILGSAGGGEIAIDPWDQSGMKTFQKLFQFDLEIQEPVENVKVGGRVYVRFDHGREPLAFQWYRSLRQLFLRRFNV
jgi:putative peptide zinc metalloprotease protein